MAEPPKAPLTVNMRTAITLLEVFVVAVVLAFVVTVASGTLEMQALAAGLPVIAFDIEGVREPFGTGVLSNYLIPVGDAKGLADSLAQVMDDSKLRETLGEAARKRAEQACAIEVRVKRIESILAELVRAAA